MGIPGAPSFFQLGFYQDTAAGVAEGVPPYHTLVNGSQVAAKSAPRVKVQLIWLPGSLTWNIFYGTSTVADYTVTMTEGEAYTYVQPFGGNLFRGTLHVPATGGQQVIMNLWTANQQALPSPVSVTIDSFTYTPA